MLKYSCDGLFRSVFFFLFSAEADSGVCTCYDENEVLMIDEEMVNAFYITGAKRMKC